MKGVWEFFKKLYWDAYELPSYYLKIEGELECHLFTIGFILFILLMIIWIIKMQKEILVIRKERRAMKKRIDKLLLGVLEERDKNKKAKNI